MMDRKNRWKTAKKDNHKLFNSIQKIDNYYY